MRRIGWLLTAASVALPLAGASAQVAGAGPAAGTRAETGRAPATPQTSPNQNMVTRGADPAPGAAPVIRDGTGAAPTDGSAAGTDVIGGRIPPGGRSGTYSSGGMTVDGTGGAGMAGSTQGGIAGASTGAVGGPGPVSTDMGRPSGGP